MRIGQHLGLPGVIAAFDGELKYQRFEIGPCVIDVLHFAQRHRSDAVATLTDSYYQIFRNQMR
ncbi:hypothetical protein D3C73_1531700 [compost metagenome]